MTRLLALSPLLILAACATTRAAPPEPIVRTFEVKVPTPVPCPALAALGTAPAYPDTDQALAGAANLFERVKLLLAGRVLRMQREAAIGAIVGACR